MTTSIKSSRVENLKTCFVCKEEKSDMEFQMGTERKKVQLCSKNCFADYMRLLASVKSMKISVKIIGLKKTDEK